ncbi:hypothetical protein [Bdellovibrio sp. HCB274]|uniref:hypothetical protein n=1 Tax=Bdellovibrio sp. HCB274 TaxID=3394361 RepID=UPI0039B3B3B9
MKTIRYLAFVLVFGSVALHANQALAEGSFAKLAFFYNSNTAEESGSSSKTSRMVYDVSAYYMFQGSSWVLGALYQNENSSSTASVDRTSYGVSGGYMTKKESGFYMLATYFVSSKYGDYDGGNGYQVDLGYKVPTRIPLAFQISYKHFDYSKYDHSDTLLDPYFGVMIMF